jgi:hypothetical protein
MHQSDVKSLLSKYAHELKATGCSVRYDEDEQEWVFSEPGEFTVRHKVFLPIALRLGTLMNAGGMPDECIELREFGL